MSEQTKSPVINGYVIDNSLLERKPIARCQISACKGGCCADGVWVDMAQARTILDHSEMIAPFMPPERRDTDTWFAEYYNDDPSFPSGEYIGTTTVLDPTHPGGSTCIFLRPEDRYCAIQAASLANGRPGWELKPYYCCLFPVVDEHFSDGSKRLLLDSDNSLFLQGGGCFRGCDAIQPIFQVYAEEMAVALGVDGYRELCLDQGEESRL